MSPLRLVQERLARGPLYPWRMAVACALLNRTTGAQGVPAAMAVLARWPTPEALACADPRKVQRQIRRCGLWRRRAETLRNMSVDQIAGEPFAEWRGVGRYALDSHAIFVEGRWPLGVTDGKLRPYLAWARKNKVRRRMAR